MNWTRHLTWRLSAGFLVLVYLMAAAAPFLAPYSPATQFRDYFLKSPTAIHFRDHSGRWHLRPFIYDYEPAGNGAIYRETERRLPIRFFVSGQPYRWMGRTWTVHLFGLEDRSKQIFLLGSDALGRDLFSRILYGARFSLTIGLVGILFTALLGIGVGCWSGYRGGWADRILMRVADLFLSLPGLFLVLGLRALFPLQLSAWEVYWMVVFLFTLMSWPSLARVIRGQVLTLKSRDYVRAAQVAGASHGRILVRHILPFTSNYLLVHSTVLVPAFILGEITLSFLGVGVQEPDASWGNLLEAANSIRAITRYPWLLSPAVFIFCTVLAFNLVGGELKALDRQRREVW